MKQLLRLFTHVINVCMLSRMHRWRWWTDIICRDLNRLESLILVRTLHVGVSLLDDRRWRRGSVKFWRELIERIHPLSCRGLVHVRVSHVALRGCWIIVGLERVRVMHWVRSRRGSRLWLVDHTRSLEMFGKVVKWFPVWVTVCKTCNTLATKLTIAGCDVTATGAALGTNRKSSAVDSWDDRGCLAFGCVGWIFLKTQARKRKHW